MNKKTKVISVLMLLTLGLLLFSIRMANKPAKAKTTPETKETITDATGTETTTEKGAEQTEIAPVSNEDFWTEVANLSKNSRMLETPIYYHPTKRDPMQPTFIRAEADQPAAFKLIIKVGAPKPTLTGILLGNSRTGGAAIINDKIYRIGEIVNDKKIIAIERNRVILKRGMDEEILRLENN